MIYDRIPRIQIDFTETETKHFHEELELLYLLKGTLKVTAGQDTYCLLKDDIIVINGGIPHSLTSEPQKCIACRFMIPRSFIRDAIQNNLFLIWCNSASDKQSDYSRLRKILQDITRHYLLKKQPDLYYQGNFYHMLYCLAEDYLIQHNDIRYQNYISKEDERTGLILSYIHENYNKDISLRKLAEQLYLTDAYLSRFFKKTIGVNFSVYLNGIKLQHAAEDLLYSAKSITRIAMDNGFSNMAAFNKSFRNMYQVTPSTYRDTARSPLDSPTSLTEQQQSDLLENLTYRQKEPAALTKRNRLQKSILSFDVAQQQKLSRPWQKLMNVGELSALLNYRIRLQLLQVTNHLKISHVRFWNILSNSMNLGAFISKEIQDYDFNRLDECLDFLIQNHLKPIFHMGYKKDHKNAAMEQDEYTYIQHIFSFQSLEEIEQVFIFVLTHMISRYGREEVGSWYFELWYPNVYYVLPDFLDQNLRTIYSSTLYRIIRQMLPEAKIGAAEFSLLMESDKIYERLLCFKQQGLIPDFISYVSYPYRLSDQEEFLKEWYFDEKFLIRETKKLKEVLRQIGWDQLPIWLTEYNCTILNQNPLNDSRFRGSWLIKNMIDIIDLIEVAGVWQLSDLNLYPENHRSHQLLYGSNGIITKDGISKPAYFSLYFLTNLKPFLISKGDHYILTAGNDGSYSLILHNMKPLGPESYLKPEAKIVVNDMEFIFDNEDVYCVKIELRNIHPGHYGIKRLTVNQEHGDIQEWVSKNDQSLVRKNSDIWHLQHMCIPDMRFYSEQIKDTLSIEATIEANSFVFYEIKKEV